MALMIYAPIGTLKSAPANHQNMGLYWYGVAALCVGYFPTASFFWIVPAINALTGAGFMIQVKGR